jgi:hypothetical protein
VIVLVDLVGIQAAYYMVAATGVLVAAVFYILNLQAQQKNMKANLETRQAQLFRDFLKTQKSLEFTKIMRELFFDWKWTDFDDYWKKYTDPEPITKFNMLVTYWEGLAVMVRRGLISPELIYDLNYNTIIGLWERFALIISGMRVKSSSPQLYEPIEWLYGEMKRIQASKGHSYIIPDMRK